MQAEIEDKETQVQKFQEQLKKMDKNK